MRGARVKFVMDFVRGPSWRRTIFATCRVDDCGFGRLPLRLVIERVRWAGSLVLKTVVEEV